MALSEQTTLRLAESFAVGIKSPFAPTLCPMCFSIFYTRLENDDKTMLALQTQRHPYWNALMSFVSAEWTADRRASVGSLLHRTFVRCRNCTAAQHVTKAEFTDPKFDIVYTTACQFLGTVLGSSLKLASKGFGNRKGRWPTSADDLFPYGPEKTVASLVGQLMSNAQSGVVIINLIHIHRHIVLPVILQEQQRVQLLKAAISHLETCSTLASADLARLLSPVLPAARDAAVRKRLGQCPMFFLLFYLLSFGAGADQQDKRHLVAGWETQPFKALDGVLALLTGDILGLNHEIELFGRYLWTRLPPAARQELACVDPPHYIGDPKADRAEILSDPYLALHFYLNQRANSAHGSCDWPGCAMRVREKAFARCGKCRSVQYCSRECQRAGWKSAAYPHKELCDMLRELLAATELGASGEQFADACHARKFPLEGVDRLINWATEGKMFHQYALIYVRAEGSGYDEA